MSLSEYRPDDYSDAGNAELFRTSWQGLLCWVDALGWLRYDGRCWTRDDHEAVNAAVTLTDAMLDEARQEYAIATMAEADAKVAVANEIPGATERLAEAQKSVKTAKAYLAHAQNSRSAARIKGMLELSRSRLVIPADKLDSDPFLLNCPDGVVDLRTGQLKPHDTDSPYQFHTRITTATPGIDPDGALLWMKFLETITCGDYALCEYLQLVVGMCAVGKVFHEGIIICVGSGRNGKSTFWNAVSAVLGDYSGTINPTVLTTKEQNRGAQLASIRGRRLVLASELEEHERLSTSTLKQLASSDRMVIEAKYHQPETVTPSHTLILATNFLPRVSATDDGTWRRLAIAPFQAVIPDADDIPDYANYLVEHAGKYIVSWIVDGAKKFTENGHKLTEPDAVQQATMAYRQNENWLDRFLDEYCTRDPAVKAPARALYTSFKNWCTDTGEYIHRENDFSAAMERAGFRKRRTKAGMMYHGVALRYSANAGNSWAATG